MNKISVDHMPSKQDLFKKDEENRKIKTAIVFGYKKLESPIIKDRVQKACDLFQKKRIKRIIFTGANGEAEKMEELALEILGKQPGGTIELESQAKNTIQNIKNCKDLLDDEDSSKGIALVSSSWHMWRVLKLAQHYLKGYDFLCWPADDRSDANDQSKLEDLVATELRNIENRFISK